MPYDFFRKILSVLSKIFVSFSIYVLNNGNIHAESVKNVVIKKSFFLDIQRMIYIQSL